MPSIFDEIGGAIRDAVTPDKPKKPVKPDRSHDVPRPKPKTKTVKVKADRSHDVPIPESHRDDVAAAAASNRAEAKAKRVREKHERLVAHQQAKIWGTEQAVMPWEVDIFKPPAPPTIKFNQLERPKGKPRAPNTAWDGSPAVLNADGSRSSVRSMSFDEKGREVLVPTVWNGKIHSDEQAIARYKRTGQHFGKYGSVEEANKAADLLHRQEEQRGTMGFSTLGHPDPGVSPASQAARDIEKERRERAKLADAALMPGSKEREKFVRGIAPGRRKELTTGRQPPPHPKLSLENRIDVQSAGFFGHIPGASDFFKDVASKAPGDFWKFLSGTYGMGADYAHAAYEDIGTLNTAVASLGRGGQGAALPKQTAGLVKRDTIGLAAAYETAVPEFPSWMGGNFQVVEYDPKKGFKIAHTSAEVTEEGRQAFHEVWSQDPFLTALLFVPVLAGAGKAVSIRGLERSIAKANPGLSRRTVLRFAAEESKRPGYLWGHDIRGGYRTRKIGAKRKTTGEVFEGEATGEALASGTARYSEKGEPGYQYQKGRGGEKHAIYRDNNGEVRGYAVAGDEAISVYVDPAYRRQGIANELYDTLKANGVKVDELSGSRPMSVAGQALAAARDQVPGRPWSRTPHGRAIQKGYDRASDWVEVYLGPNAPVLGKYSQSTRAARATQRRQHDEIARAGALIDRDTRAISGAIKRGENGIIDEVALFAALQGPKHLSHRRGIELMRDHLKQQEEPPLPLIDVLDKALEGTWVDETEFAAGVQAMKRISQQGDHLFREITGSSAWALADRRDRITRAYEEAGLLTDEDGLKLPSELGGPLPGPTTLHAKVLDLERQLEDVDPATPEGQALLAEYAKAVQEHEATTARVGALIDQIAKDEIFEAQWHEAARKGNTNYLPEGAQTVEGLTKLLHETHTRLVEGWPYGHTWYEDSGRTILRHAGGDIDRADRMAALMAIYSPQRAVTPNFGLAMRAEKMWNEGEARGIPKDERITLGSEGQRKQAAAAMDGKDWRDMLGSEAPKIRRFYGNLLKHIDRGRMVSRGYDGREVTVDGWIAAAFHYGSNTKNATMSNRAYPVLERMIQRMADDLGIEPEAAQAAMWVSIKASNDRYLQNLPRDRQLRAASGSFSDASDLETHNVRFAFEAASKEIPEYETWSPEVQQIFMDANAQNVLRTMQGHGLYAKITDNGIGVFINAEGKIEQNPMAALEMSVGSLATDSRLQLGPGDRSLYDGVAALIGKHLKQEGQGWLRPLVSKAAIEHTFYRLPDVSPEEIALLARELDGHGYVSPTRDGAIIAHLNPDSVLDAVGAQRKIRSEDFRDRVKAAVARHVGDEAALTLEGGSHRGGYLGGLEDYGSAINTGGRSDLLRRIDRDLSDSTAEIRDAFRADPERAARDYGARAAPEVEDYRWEAHGYFPHRKEGDFIPGSLMPTALAAAGDTVGVAKAARGVLERRRNELELYGSGKVSTDPRKLANVVRGRIKYAKTVEGRQYLYDRGISLKSGTVPSKREGKFFFVRDPASLPTKIPNEIKEILAHPDKFHEGDVDALAAWRNEWLVEATPEGPPAEWLENVRLVPAGNVQTLLGDAFYSAPRGTGASIAAMLNSVARATVIYLPFGGTRYVIRNTVQNMILMALTHPTAFKNVGAAVRLARKDKELWDAAVVQTGGFPAAAGLPSRAARGENWAQRAEKRATGVSRGISSALSNVADEPFRVAAIMKYAEEYGFEGIDGFRKVMESEEPGVVNVRRQISQQVRDDMLDFNTLSPAIQEKAARYLFILPFQAAALKWPVTFARDQTMRAAVVALVAAQHEREEGGWGDVLLNGRMVSLSWLSPIAPSIETGGAIAETIKASMGGPDLSPLAGLLSPEWRDLVRSLSRGGLSWDQAAKTWVPMYKSGKEMLAFSRGQENLDELVMSYLGSKPYRFSQSTKGKATEWADGAADLWGAVPKEFVEAKASKEQYESENEGLTEHQRVKLQAEYYFKAHPEEKAELYDFWMKRIQQTPTDELDNWSNTFDKELGWDNITRMDSRIEVYESMNEYLERHPEDEQYRELWRKDIASADDDRLSGWRKTLAEDTEKAVA